MITHNNPFESSTAPVEFLLNSIPEKIKPLKSGKSELIITDKEKLKIKCQEFDFNNPPFDPIEFSKKLVKEMRDFGGIGLAANQIGCLYRIIAIRSNPNLVLFNPRIITPSTETVYLEEGCLSFPGLFVKIKRPKHIRIRFENANGQTETQQYSGMTARIIQHEIDHLDGIIFYDKATRFHREKAFKKWKKVV